MQNLWKLCVIFGLVLVIGGLLLRLAGGRLGWLGHLPGDLRFGTVFIPLATCALLSIVLTVILNLLVRIFWK